VRRGFIGKRRALSRRQRRVVRIGATAAVLAAATYGIDAFIDRASATVASVLGYSLIALSIAAGATLVWAGATLALTRESGWWRLGAVPLLLVGAFWSLVPLGLAAYATHPARTESPALTPASVGLRYEDVTITAPDGVELAAWYVPARNRGAVLLLHGAGSTTRQNVLRHAAVLARNGYGVLMLDARGHGDSAGSAMEFGWFGQRDVSVAIDWLEERPGIDPPRVGVVGLSMGGEQALTAAAADTRIKAVVAEGATHRVYEDVRTTLAGVETVLGIPQYRALFGVADLLTAAEPPVPLAEAVEAIAPRRVLLLGTAAEAEYGDIYATAAPDVVQRWSPASEKHIGALAENPMQWERRVVGFLDQSLLEMR